MFESLRNVKRYQPQNAVYLLCVNWSHWKVIKENKTEPFNRYPKHTHLTSIDEFRREAPLGNGKTQHSAQRTHERERKKATYVSEKWTHASDLRPLVAVYITRQLINSPAEQTRQLHQVITSVNIQRWKAKLVLTCIRVKCWVEKKIGFKGGIFVYISSVCVCVCVCTFFGVLVLCVACGCVIDGRHEHTFIWLIYLFSHYFRWRSCRHNQHTHTIFFTRREEAKKNHGSKVRGVECFGFVDFSLLVLFPTMDPTKTTMTTMMMVVARWWWWYVFVRFVWSSTFVVRFAFRQLYKLNMNYSTRCGGDKTERIENWRAEENEGKKNTPNRMMPVNQKLNVFFLCHYWMMQQKYSSSMPWPSERNRPIFKDGATERAREKARAEVATKSKQSITECKRKSKTDQNVKFKRVILLFLAW